MKKAFFGIFAVLLSFSLVRLFFIGDDATPLTIGGLLSALEDFGDSLLENLFSFPELFKSFSNLFNNSFDFNSTLYNLVSCIGQLIYLPFELLFRVIYIVTDIWNLLAALTGMPSIPPFSIPNPFPSGIAPSTGPFGGGGGGAR